MSDCLWTNVLSADGYSPWKDTSLLLCVCGRGAREMKTKVTGRPDMPPVEEISRICRLGYDAACDDVSGRISDLLIIGEVKWSRTFGRKKQSQKFPFLDVSSLGAILGSGGPLERSRTGDEAWTHTRGLESGQGINMGQPAQFLAVLLPCSPHHAMSNALPQQIPLPSSPSLLTQPP